MWKSWAFGRGDGEIHFLLHPTAMSFIIKSYSAQLVLRKVSGVKDFKICIHLEFSTLHPGFLNLKNCLEGTTVCEQKAFSSNEIACQWDPLMSPLPSHLFPLFDSVVVNTEGDGEDDRFS